MPTAPSCGTGGWTGPLPGDPDNNSILSATPVYGGIEVSWTYPEVNSHAVAHTILYRGLTADFLSAVQLRIVAGNSYFDKTTNLQLLEYFYWIRIVSVNGTVGELIGPASATAKPTIAQTIELLTGAIDAGVLAESLKTEIAAISSLGASLNTEMQARLTDNAALGAVLSEVQFNLDTVTTYVVDAINTSVDADGALAESINALGLVVANAAALASEEKLVRIAKDELLAASVNTVQVSLGNDIAAVQTGLQANINTVYGKVSDIGALYTAKVTVNGLIGGFGVYNDGTEVQAGFDVDNFWIGRTSLNKRKPFIIVGEEVFIDQAIINELTFNKLRDATGQFVVEDGKVKAEYLRVTNASIAGAIYSDNWVPGVSGWYLDKSGDLYANNGDFRGEIYASKINGDVNKIAAVTGNYGLIYVGNNSNTLVYSAILPAASHVDGHTPSAVITVYIDSPGAAAGAMVRLYIGGQQVAESHSYVNNVTTITVAGTIAKTIGATSIEVRASGTAGHAVRVGEIRGYIMGIR